MIDEKAAPPAYMAPPPQPDREVSYTPPTHPPPAQSYPPQGPQSGYGSPPQGPPPQNSYFNTPPGAPGQSPAGGMPGYPPAQTPHGGMGQNAANIGQQYQQQRESFLFVHSRKNGIYRRRHRHSLSHSVPLSKLIHIRCHVPAIVVFAMCAQGNHDIETKYGVAGIITAVLCFPCGLFCLFADTEKRCVRCGTRVA
ncbi:hypothetical protein C8Q76DRAFT_482262 [Earliella scabrosa]|nr:hypothetical protein C8Q76DRAFT_482262 [Earliella scabrosa]